MGMGFFGLRCTALCSICSNSLHLEGGAWAVQVCKGLILYLLVAGLGSGARMNTTSLLLQEQAESCLLRVQLAS